MNYSTHHNRCVKIVQCEDPSKQLYEWIKTGVISLAEYRKLLNILEDVAEADAEIDHTRGVGSPAGHH